ncbi:hypothetical protein I316_01712 [Kwoniella heveanensis BCC8398]|uniref:LIM zinc-binding domain-containing protein n=1 Tax=Kwoniella heveanensis BCC8398 TaxID=1296120 RepID=A0A1B9GZL7_9TREE|nr:hypothetical protein I316_01712 [Kwoniella heveanensis BCC8398]
MSLLAPQQALKERASVVLPTVTCSSCAASIPLSSLGEHVCVSGSSTARGMPDRHAPRPSQISIPQSRSSTPMQRSASANGPSSTNIRPPFAGPSSAYPSPTELHVPRRPSAANLSPHDPSPNGQSAYIVPVKTPSPTNPFFPHPDQQQTGSMMNGLGLGAGQGESSPMIDTTSGGESGMAGVGRRAFAAAAWGVRAGVALASSAKNQVESHVHTTSSQLTAWPQPQPQPQSQPSSQTTPREPPLLPKVPLSGRQRSGPSPAFNSRPELHHSSSMPMDPSSSSHSPPRRSASAMSQRSAPSSPPRRKESVSSTGSRGQNESISQILRARNPTAPAKSNTQGFFDKVKELHSRSNTASPTLGASMTRSGSGGSSSDRFVASPQPTTFELDDEYDDQHSALPWATPALGESPVINRAAPERKLEATHHRYPTAGSEASSSSSSSRSGRWGANSGPESEEVVTPSQSLEILSDRANGPIRRDDATFKGYGNGMAMEGRDLLDKIGEEDEDDEGERVVFGTPTARNIKGDGYESRIPHSRSNSTITSNRPYLPTTAPHSSPNRSRRPSVEGGRSHSHTYTHGHNHSGSTSSSSDLGSGSARRKKICVKCGDSVGGSKRFVERDGVVLCERDWKKLYLPSCRRCNLPIEKSAVSSSDGQLKGKWHRACFTCTRCDRPFEGDDFYVHGGKPWCQYHYHEENGTLCASGSCHQPIEGPCILTPGPNPQRFHPGHLRCDHRGGVSSAQNCKESMDEYYDVGGKRYCERHVGEATRGVDGTGRSMTMRAEKRRTRLVDLPVGGLGF